MFCSNCGKKIDDGSKFCQFCGSPIKDNVNQSMPHQQPQIPVGKKINPLLVGGIGLGCLAVVLCGVRLLTSDKQDSPAEVAVTESVPVEDSTDNTEVEETDTGNDIYYVNEDDTSLESDSVAGDSVSKEQDDEFLSAYTDYIEEVFAEDNILGYNFIYIDADDAPECLVWTTNEYNQLGRVFVLSYKNGEIESVTTEGDLSSSVTVGYIPRSGDFWVGLTDWHWSSDDVFLLDDSFHKVVSLYGGSGDAYNPDGTLLINGQDANSEEYDEITSDIYSDKYTRLNVDMYGQNYDAIYSTLSAAYDALRTTTYKAYAPEVAEFELKDGILTLTTQDPSNGGSIDSEEVWHNVDPLFSISYPVAEDCTWEYGHDEGGFVLDEYGSFETMKEDVIADKDEIYSPFSLYIEVIDDIVVRVYSIQS